MTHSNDFDKVLTKIQRHEKAKHFMTKVFPLFDDIVELCDDAIETGTGEFWVTGQASSEQDADGSGEGDEEGRGTLSSSEVEPLVCLGLACVLSHFHSLTQTLKDLISITPANLTSKTGKHQVKEFPHDSGCKPDKCQYCSGAEGFFHSLKLWSQWPVPLLQSVVNQGPLQPPS